MCLELQVKESRSKGQDEEDSSGWVIIRNESFCAGLSVRVAQNRMPQKGETSAQP